MRILHMIGNAHLDLAWIWPWQEGFGEVKATFLSALQRMEEFGGFIFTSSSAQYYQFVEENAPDLFEQIKARIAQGRWILCGGWWVQPDCNLPSGEAFVRQGLYGQRYFLSRFGVTAATGYNVDSFGHNAGLPQILKKSGMDRYLFLRPRDNEKELPRGVFLWEGPDGSQVQAARVPFSYSSIPSLKEQIAECLARFPEDSQHGLCFYGVGNHGGGPTIQNIRYILENAQADPEFTMLLSDPEQYFDAVLQEGHSLPKFKGELQHHSVGCYSAVSHIKQQNRQGENALVTAEIYTVLAELLGQSPKIQFCLHKEWMQLLSCQFHDVLCGAGTEQVCNDAIKMLGGVCTGAEYAANHALQAISFAVDIPYDEGGQPLVVFNPHSFPVKTIVSHEKGTWGNLSFPDSCQVLDSHGQPVPFQFGRLHAQFDERKRISFLAELPPLGYSLYRIVSGGSKYQAIPLESPKNILENAYVRVTIDPDTGRISSYYDKQSKHEYLKSPSALFRIHEDFSDTWAHGAERFDGPFQDAVLKSMYPLENGPVFQSICAFYQFGRSTLRQTFTLRADSPVLDVSVKINWQERFSCLKLLFCLDLAQPEATWEVPFGTIRRPTDGHEEPMQTWVDLSEASHTWGMAFAVAGKGGAHILDSTFGLTVLRCPVYAHHEPHKLQEPLEAYSFTDQGEQEFTYRMIPHQGSWQDGKVPQEALVLNRPAAKVAETFHPGPLPAACQALQIEAENVLLSTIKPALDGSGTIIRLYEAYGKPVKTRISLAAIQQNWQMEFTPYEVKTFLLRPGQAPLACTLTELPLEEQESGAQV